MSRLNRLALMVLGAFGLVAGTVVMIRPAAVVPWWSRRLVVRAAVAVLLGLGRRHQPLYLLAILAVPAGFYGSRFLPAWLPVGLVVGVLAGIAAAVVNLHYARRGAGR